MCKQKSSDSTIFGLKFHIVILFISLIIFGLILVNNYHKKRTLDSIKILDDLQRHFIENINDITEERIKTYINQATATTKYLNIETQIHSSVLLLLIFILSSLIVIIYIYRLIQPLINLKKASVSIKDGNFNVVVKPEGIKEIKDLINSFNDLTNELKNTQEKLLISEKEALWKGLSQILAHEIKNPLTPIQLTIQRLEEKFYSDVDKMLDVFPESVKIIYQEINNLLYLASSFSTYAKEIVPVQTTLNPIEEVKKIIEPYLSKYDVKIVLHNEFPFQSTQNEINTHTIIYDSFATKGSHSIPDYIIESDQSICSTIGENESFIIFDKSHFYQIITNIFNNAVEACENNPKICISIVTFEGFMSLKIIDNGSGIAKEKIPKIFDPYYTDKNFGTGLGLALVKKLCIANQCLVKVQSVLGVGTSIELIKETVC